MICSPYNIDINRFSKFSRVIRVTAIVTRYLLNLRYKNDKKSSTLTVSEIANAEKLWVIYLQNTHFQNEKEAILNKTKNNLVRQLGLQIDIEGIIRCYGSRLDFSHLPGNAKNPILLPSYHHFTHILIDHTHRSLFHTGVQVLGDKGV